jgi:hypothetical protein
MPSKVDRSRWICSFRGFVAGGAKPGAFICSECIALAHEMAAEGAFS